MFVSEVLLGREGGGGLRGAEMFVASEAVGWMGRPCNARECSRSGESLVRQLEWSMEMEDVTWDAGWGYEAQQWNFED